MRVPKKVRVNGVDYPIEITKDPILVEHRECLGAVTYYKHIIQIKKGDDVDEQQRCETLLHEIIHVILDDREIDFEDDESIAEQFARAWYQIIEDNPTMFLPKKDVKK